MCGIVAYIGKKPAATLLLEGLKRLAIEGQSELGHLLARGGFREIDRHDGHHETGDADGYGAWLRARGYDSANPWSDHVISAIDEGGQVVSGWHMRNVHLPARVQEAHSETAYMTDQAIGWVSASSVRYRVLAWSGILYGLLLIVVSLLFFGSDSPQNPLP